MTNQKSMEYPHPIRDNQEIYGGRVMKFNSKRLKASRRACGHTLQSLGDIIESSKSYVWELEDGTRRIEPSGRKVFLMAKALGKPMEFFYGSDDEAPYGYCPHCGAKGISRERRPDGNDRCASGHVYPSREGVTK